MDPQMRAMLVDTMVREFGALDDYRDWVADRFPDLVRSGTLPAGTFETQVTSLVQWAEAKAGEAILLQQLADHPPSGGRQLPILVHYISGGLVRPTGAEFPPVLAHEDWFVTKRPFANRVTLRGLLRTLHAAAPGADSILVIDGPGLSGKTLGARLVGQCAPADQLIPIDVEVWAPNQLRAWELASALYPAAASEIDSQTWDESKEASVVPRLLTWLKAKLRDETAWIVIDSCSSPSLTEPAQTLLYHLATEMDAGHLRNVRLVLVDVGKLRLPPIRSRCRWDTADLPDRKAVSDWLTTLADHLRTAGLLQQPCTPAEVDGWTEKVFAGLPATYERDQLVIVLEGRLLEAYRKIKAH